MVATRELCGSATSPKIYNFITQQKMKETKNIAKGANFTATDFGKLNEIKDYVLALSAEVKIPGKVFGGQSVNATGAEFSF